MKYLFYTLLLGLTINQAVRADAGCTTKIVEFENRLAALEHVIAVIKDNRNSETISKNDVHACRYYAQLCLQNCKYGNQQIQDFVGRGATQEEADKKAYNQCLSALVTEGAESCKKSACWSDN